MGVVKLIARCIMRGLGFGLVVISLVSLSPSKSGSSAALTTAGGGELGNRNLAAGPVLICGPLETFSLDRVDADVLWLARAIYSETKREEEQELVAWVIRNRLESGWRGRTSYEKVVLDPYQFSAFNPGYPRRGYYVTRDVDYGDPIWQSALRISYDVIRADSSRRPFSSDTRHFYSEISMVGGITPVWAMQRNPVELRDFEIEPRRFRFFEGIM